MRVTIIRLGKVSGPAHEDKKWRMEEPPRVATESSVLSSRFLHMLPASLGGGFDAVQETRVDWIPIDELAAKILIVPT